jgi:hypothetical protein
MASPRRMSVVDRVGERYGRLVVTARAENKIEPSGAVRAQWKCLCDCGRETVVPGQSLSRGTTRSCGCLSKEKVIERTTTHGLSRSGTYRSWHTMVQRCTNPLSTHWKSYGGRGITVCDEWLTFENFHRDVGDRPENMTLERVENNKGYEPGNVIWASRLTQANNRRTNVLVTLGDETHSIAEWGRITGLGKSVVAGRLEAGWSVVKALTTQLQDTGKRRRK